MKKGIIHGDPRVYNIVRIGETLKWIDFREYRSDDAATASLMAKDMQTCIKSFFKKDSQQRLVDRIFSSDAVTALLINYGNTPNEPNGLAILDNLTVMLAG